MNATDHIGKAFAIGLAQEQEIHSKWVAIAGKLATISGVAHWGSSASDSRLDLLLLAMERDCLEHLKNPKPHEFILSHDIFMSLSECWVLRTYEVIRAAWERSGKPIEGKLSQFKHRLGLVRVPIAKGEIQHPKNFKETILLGKMGEPESAPYAPNGSYIIPRTVCLETGAVMWVTIDVKSHQSVEICRRDLSNEFLALFD